MSAEDIISKLYVRDSISFKSDLEGVCTHQRYDHLQLCDQVAWIYQRYHHLYLRLGGTIQCNYTFGCD